MDTDTPMTFSYPKRELCYIFAGSLVYFLVVEATFLRRSAIKAHPNLLRSRFFIIKKGNGEKGNLFIVGTTVERLKQQHVSYIYCRL